VLGTSIVTDKLQDVLEQEGLFQQWYTPLATWQHSPRPNH